MTDEELVDLARQGDPDAFGQLVIRHQAGVYRTVLAAVRVPSDAEELAQDAFVRAWRNLDRFRGQASFRTWLLTIAWNRAISRRRSIMRWFRGAAPLDAATATTGETGEIGLQRHELRAAVVTAIDRLSPKLRDTLLLAQSGEHGYDEIAVMLAIPVGTVKWRVSEARRKVRAELVAKGVVDAR